ncbi:hypothetical protein ACOME3_006479 [Neoechinorhynchus agilis]
MQILGNDSTTITEKKADTNFEELISNNILPYLRQLCQIRSKLIGFYESFATNVTNCNQIDHKCECLVAIKSLSSEFKSTSSSMNSMSTISRAQIMKPLMNLVREEIDVFMHILSAELKIREFKYFDSLLHLHSASFVIKKWSNYTFSEGRFFSKRQQFPLVTWFNRLYEGLTAKFTFYFYTVLLSNAPPSGGHSGRSSECPNELKQFPIKSLDIHGKIVAFQKKNQNYHIGLVTSMLHPNPNGSDKVPFLRGASRQAVNSAWGYTLPKSADFDIHDENSDLSQSFGSHHHLHRVSQSQQHSKPKKKQRTQMVLSYAYPPQSSNSIGSAIWWAGICEPIHSILNQCDDDVDVREKPVYFSVQTKVVPLPPTPSHRQPSRGRISKRSETESSTAESAVDRVRSGSDIRTNSLGRNTLQTQNCVVYAQAVDNDRCTLLLVVANNGNITSCNQLSHKMGSLTSTPATIECLANITAPSSQSLLQTAEAATVKPSVVNKDSPVSQLFVDVIPMLRLEKQFIFLKASIK